MILYVYVPGVDRTVELAIEAGGRVLVPAKDHFWAARGLSAPPYGA